MDMFEALPRRSVEPHGTSTLLMNSSPVIFVFGAPSMWRSWARGIQGLYAPGAIRFPLKNVNDRYISLDISSVVRPWIAFWSRSLF